MNPRVSRSSALASKATGLPDRQDRRAARRRLHARGDPERHHARHAASASSRRSTTSSSSGRASRSRSSPAPTPRLSTHMKSRRRGDGDRAHVPAGVREGDALARARRAPSRRPTASCSARSSPRRRPLRPVLEAFAARPSVERSTARRDRPLVPARAARAGARPAGAVRRGAVLQVGRHLRRRVRGRARRTTTRAGSGPTAAPTRSSAATAQSVVILGAGPNRIGQGIEFDYCCVHAAMTVRESGRDAVMINCNPETVSTDYDTSDRLYFEPLTLEDVLGVCRGRAARGRDRPVRRPDAAEARRRAGRGRRADARARASTRSTWPRTAAASASCWSGSATRRRRTRPRGSVEEALAAAQHVGFPLLVRPSYVLGGRAMEIVYSVEGLEDYLAAPSPATGPRDLPRPLPGGRDRGRRRRAVRRRGRLDRRDHAARRGGRRSIPATRACVLPPHSLGPEMLDEIREHTRGIALGARRRRAAQRAVRASLGGDLYVIEANPRASRTVPFVSQGDRPAAGQAGLPGDARRADRRPRPARGPDAASHVSVKEAVLPFDRFDGADALLGPEMRSTGEVMGVARDFPTAFAKAQAAAGRGAARRAAPRSSPSPTRDKPGAVGDRRAAARPRLRDRRHARHRGGDRADGDPGERARQDRRGLAARRRLDRARRRRPRRQHADGHRRAHRRLARSARAAVARGIPCITTMSGGMAAARAIAAARAASAAVLSLQELHRGARERRVRPHRGSQRATAHAPRGRARSRRSAGAG